MSKPKFIGWTLAFILGIVGGSLLFSGLIERSAYCGDIHSKCVVIVKSNGNSFWKVVRNDDAMECRYENSDRDRDGDIVNCYFDEVWKCPSERCGIEENPEKIQILVWGGTGLASLCVVAMCVLCVV